MGDEPGPAPLNQSRPKWQISRWQPWRRLRWLAFLSLVLHALLLVVALWSPKSLPRQDTELPSPVAMVFEPREQGRASVPEPGDAPAQSSLTPPPAPPTSEPAPHTDATPPEAPSVATSEPPSPATAMPEPPPSALPAPPVATPTLHAPPPPTLAQPAPPPPVPSSAAPVSPEAKSPASPAAPTSPAAPAIPEAPAFPDEEPVVPPSRPEIAPAPPPPDLPVPPRPQPEPRRQATGPSGPSSGFPAPSSFSLGAGRPLGAGRSPEAAPSSARPSANAWAPPRAPQAPQSFGDFATILEGHVDPSWLSALREWWNRHSYYPQQAAALGQDGTVGIQIVVDKYGNVTQLRLQSRSGSQWLDLAAQSVFRGAKLPSLMPYTPTDQVKLDLTIHYILVNP